MTTRKLLMVSVLLSYLCSMSGKVCCNSLCAFKKSDTECMCVYKNFPTSIFPELVADCTRMGWSKFPQMEDVEELDLSHNSIETLDPFKTNIKSTQMRSLKISYNRLGFIHQEFFKGMPNLVRLDLSNNQLVKFTNSLTFVGLSKLHVLSLRSNQISTLPDNIFLDLQNLKDLDLSYNYLGSLFSNSANILELNLGITSGLNSLKLDGLGITNISSKFFDGTVNLRYLSLSDNALLQIPKIPTSVVYLDLSATEIATINPSELTSSFLKTLKLNRLAKLELIENDAFSNLSALEELHLIGCKKLKEFNFDSLGEQVRLKKLYLLRSGVRTISDHYFNILNGMEELDLRNNPWTCDCNILWLQKLNRTLIQSSQLRCATPIKLLNRKIMELSTQDFSNCMENSSSYQTIVITVLSCLLAALSVLIIYLMYLGPLYRKNRYRNIGPQSPYNENTLSDVPSAGNI